MSNSKKLHDNGDISGELYEYMEARLALKYGISARSVFRDSFRLPPYDERKKGEDSELLGKHICKCCEKEFIDFDHFKRRLLL